VLVEKIRDYDCNPEASVKDAYLPKQEEKGHIKVLYFHLENGTKLFFDKMTKSFAF